MFLDPTESAAKSNALINLLFSADSGFCQIVADNLTNRIKLSDTVLRRLVKCELIYEGEKLDPEIYEKFLQDMHTTICNHYNKVYENQEIEIAKRVKKEVDAKMHKLITGKTGAVLERIEKLNDVLSSPEYIFNFDWETNDD